MERAPNYITREGYNRLAAEMDELRLVKRPAVVEEVSIAAAMGDRSENAEYIYGKRRLREIDRRLGFLNGRLDVAVIVDPKQQRGDRVFFGATVTLEDEDGEARTIRIVGVDEADSTRGDVSHRSPIGAALLGKSEGEGVSVTTPAGVKCYDIIDVKYI